MQVIRLKKLLIICILIVSLVFITGCIDEEKINSKVGNNESSTVSQINPKSDTNTEQKDNSLQDLEYFIDPKLKNVRIESPDIEVVRFELIDRREFENDENYGLKVLLSNDGDTPVWMDVPRFYYVGCVNHNVANKLILLKSGERKWCGISITPTSYKLYQLKDLRTLDIYSHRTVTPVISPELKSLNLDSIDILTNRQIISSRSSFPAIDINSIKYEGEGEWKYLIVGMTYNNIYSGSNLVFFKFGCGSLNTDVIDTKFTDEQSGQIQYIKIPVPKSWTIGAIDRITIM